MKKFFILIFVFFCTFFSTKAQTDTNWISTSICLGSSITWMIPNASNSDICIYSHNGIFDTIEGNTIALSPTTTTTYILISINGEQPSPYEVYACVIFIIQPPTFTVDSIHHVTCPDPYLGPGTSLYDGPWADGSFSVILNDSAQNYAYVRVNSDSYNTHEFHDDFTVGGLREGTYNIVARGTNGCEVTQHVTIQQPPAWENNSYGTPVLHCDSLGYICIDILGGTPPYSYEWIHPQDSTTFFPDTSSIFGINEGFYQTFVHDSKGCLYKNLNEGLTCTIIRIATDTIHLTYYNYPDSTNLIECPESMEVCQYKPFFNALSLGHGTYQWNTEWDTEFGHELDTTQNYTGPYETGWLSVEFTDQNGCVTRDSVYLDIYDANISITADSIMNDDSVYTVSVSPLGGTLYLDGINGTEIPIGNGIITFDASLYTLGEHFLYYAGEWGEFGCYFDTTFQFTIQHQDGISDFERNTKLWPNPTSNVLNIEFSGEFSGDILLFDMTGRLLKTTEKESEITSIDVSDLTSGVYFIRFVSQNGTFTKKFVKK